MERSYKLRPSRSLAVLGAALSLLVLTVLWLTTLPTSLQILLSLFIAGWAGVHFLQDVRLRGNTSCVAFRLQPEGGVVLVQRNGIHVHGNLLNDTLVTPYLVILRVKVQGRLLPRRVLILPDAISKEGFRMLCVSLRWKEFQAGA